MKKILVLATMAIAIGFISCSKNDDPEIFVKDGILSRYPKELTPSYPIIYLSDDITEIGPNAFKDNKQISAVVASNVTKVDDSAFEGCSNLTTVRFKKLRNIGKKAFKETPSLKFIYIGKLKTYDETSFDKNDQVTLYYPQWIEEQIKAFNTFGFTIKPDPNPAEDEYADL